MEELYECYGKMIFSAAYSVCRARDRANEVVDKVLVKIWNLSTTLEVLENPEGWLYVLSINSAKDLVKEREWLPLKEDFPDKKDILQEMIEADSFLSLIDELSAMEQEIIIDKIIQQMTFDEISEEMEKPLGTITSTYYRSLKKIKEKVEKQKNF